MRDYVRRAGDCEEYIIYPTHPITSLARRVSLAQHDGRVPDETNHAVRLAQPRLSMKFTGSLSLDDAEG